MFKNYKINRVELDDAPVASNEEKVTMSPIPNTSYELKTCRNGAPAQYLDSVQNKRLTTDHHTFNFFQQQKPNKKQCNRIETPTRT